MGWDQPASYKLPPLQPLIRFQLQSFQKPCSRDGLLNALDSKRLVSFTLSCSAFAAASCLSTGIGLAISGGVDSMALAALSSRVQDHSHSHNQTGSKEQPHEWSFSSRFKFQAFVVDHGLRTGSDIEAESVSQVLKKRGSDSQLIITYPWLNRQIRYQNASSQDSMAWTCTPSFLAQL